MWKFFHQFSGAERRLLHMDGEQGGGSSESTEKQEADPDAKAPEAESGRSVEEMQAAANQQREQVAKNQQQEQKEKERATAELDDKLKDLPDEAAEGVDTEKVVEEASDELDFDFEGKTPNEIFEHYIKIIMKKIIEFMDSILEQIRSVGDFINGVGKGSPEKAIAKIDKEIEKKEKELAAAKTEEERVAIESALSELKQQKKSKQAELAKIRDREAKNRGEKVDTSRKEEATKLVDEELRKRGWDPIETRYDAPSNKLLVRYPKGDPKIAEIQGQMGRFVQIIEQNGPNETELQIEMTDETVGNIEKLLG